MPRVREGRGGGGHDCYVIAIEECRQPTEDQHPPLQGAESRPVHELLHIEPHTPPLTIRPFGANLLAQAVFVQAVILQDRQVETKTVPGTSAVMPDDEMTVGHLIGRARSALLTGLDTELEQFGLTGAQYAVLKNVADGTADTAADLCRTMHYDTGSMTRMLDRLEEKAVLRRERCTQDRRVVYLLITATGNDLLPRLREAALRVLARHLQGFSPDEVANLKQYLARMIENGQPVSS